MDKIKLNINECGKVIVPQRESLDSQLEVLEERGKNNGAIVKIISEQEMKDLIPEARSATKEQFGAPERQL